jgi:hypothetical protein
MVSRSQWEHPWVFEQARKRKIRSWVRTFLTSQMPRRFWRSVRPVHTPRIKRLIWYWLILTILVGLSALKLRNQSLIDYYASLHHKRDQLTKSIELGLRLYPERAAEAVRQAGSVRAMVVETYPLVPRWPPLSYYWNDVPLVISIGALLIVGAMLWPWLTLLSLLLFRWSLREAQIKTTHVLRCAVYASDVSFMLAIPAASVLAHCVAVDVGGNVFFFDERTALPVFAVIYCIMTYRLTIAYREYLRFPHALATCAASQFIVLLALLCLSPWGWVF